jgi:hypothetical protein
VFPLRRNARRKRRWGIEPDAEMVHVNWIERRVDCVWEDSVGEHNRRGRAALRNGKRLYAKPSGELLVSAALFARFQVALVPGNTERILGHLNHEEIEVSVRRKTLHIDVQDFGAAGGPDRHCSFLRSPGMLLRPKASC